MTCFGDRRFVVVKSENTLIFNWIFKNWENMAPVAFRAMPKVQLK